MIRWLLPLTVILVGVMFGTGLFTFGYARGYSYLTNDPEACANCHVMEEQYSAWLKSSHRAVAGCNDCHAPHALVPKYANKAENGFWHSFYFTTGTFERPIRMRGSNREVTEAACRYCHTELAASLLHGLEVPDFDDDGRVAEPEGDAVTCTSCHDDVGHDTG